jgi:hypothetical protein
VRISFGKYRERSIMGGITRNFFDGLQGGCARRSLKGRLIKAALLLLSASALGACAIHPVQQDVTGVPTRAIVDRIRCEARLAVVDKAIDKLRKAAVEHRKDGELAVASKFDVIVAELEGDRGRRPLTFEPRRLPTERARAFYSRYINTVIAYDFLMQGVENNRAALVADPVRLITNGTAGVAVGASGEFQRDNQRHFALADTFQELLYGPLECESPDYLPENFAYPVSGRVGLTEVVDTFIDLYEDKPLSQFSDDKKVFADTLKFTTTWIGSAAPHVQIDPVGTQWGLNSPTNIGLSASRADTHTLTVALVMGKPQIIPLGVPFLGFAARTNQGQQSNKAAAFEAITNLRLRSFLDRAVVVR